MNEYLKQLSNDLVYIKHEIIGDTLKLYCESKKVQGRPVHSRKSSRSSCPFKKDAGCQRRALRKV